MNPFLTFACAACLLAPAVEAANRPRVVIVVGAPGNVEYRSQFRRWAGLWDAAAAKAGADRVQIGVAEESTGSGPTDRDRLRDALAAASADGSSGPLWLVLIGHGTFDGREAKFNLRGPDVTPAQLAEWLAPIGSRPVAVIDVASASGPFLTALSGENRVVVTATRSGDEQNFARLGQYLAESIADPAADLDKDDQVSLLEAFLTASGRLEEFTKTAARLATEHPLIDDNGDRLGTPPDWFLGIHATKRAKEGASADGVRAHQLHLIPSDRERSIPPETRRRRDEIERTIAALRDQKAALSEGDYYDRLEPLMLELARLYRDLPADPTTGGEEPPR